MTELKQKVDEKAEKRAAPDAEDGSEEAPKEQEVDETESKNDDEDDDAAEYTSNDEAEEQQAQEEADAGDDEIAEGTSVAVAYGNLDGLSKRKWYAGKILSYDSDTEKYQVKWKYPPRGKQKLFKAVAWKIRVIEEEDYERATRRGAGFVGLHRSESFIAPSEKAKQEAEATEAEDDEETEEDVEGVQVGDYVAVAYGNARAARRGKSKTGENDRDTKRYHKRFLWYAATVSAVDGDDVEVEWKFPTTKKKTWMTTQVEVQPITKKEFQRSRKIARGKPSYGLIGMARMETKANLTSG